MPHRVVVTGGPGGGKTTLIDALAARGHVTVPEAGRAIVRDHRRLGHDVRADPRTFGELMLAADLRAHELAARHDGPVFFDRGVVDVLVGFGDAVPPHVTRAARTVRYAPTVFVAPWWPAIYRTDEERHQTPAEAEATEQALRAAYTAHGYDLVDLPRAGVDERVAFVLDRILD